MIKGVQSKRVVTIVLHGTFAKDESWWRLGSPSGRTFADRLEAELAERGRSGTVWRPVLDAGMTYEEFSWTGANRHRDRVEGARKLRRSLRRLAGILDCTQEDPLEVNLVAHSHGGNVVLEALRVATPEVRVGRVILLGTPLMRATPTFRPARLMLASVLTVFLLVMMLVPFLKLFRPNEWAPSFGRVELFAWTAALTLVYGWMFWVLAEAIDAIVASCGRMLRLLFGRRNGPVYGPSASRLAVRLRGRPVIAFTSHQDEADLMLHLGAAPRRLYREWVRSTLRVPQRVIEIVLLRPFVDGIGLKLLELVLERFVLGASWLSVLFRNYEMEDLARPIAYPGGVIQRVDVTSELLPVLRERLAGGVVSPAVPSQEADAESGIDRHVASLRETLQMVSRDIVAQVRLRHSVYYQSQAVIARVAETITRRPE